MAERRELIPARLGEMIHDFTTSQPQLIFINSKF